MRSLEAAEEQGKQNYAVIVRYAWPQQFCGFAHCKNTGYIDVTKKISKQQIERFVAHREHTEQC